MQITQGKSIMITFNDMLNEQMQNEEFRKEYESIKPDMNVIRKIVDANISTNHMAEQSAGLRNTTQRDMTKKKK